MQLWPLVKILKQLRILILFEKKEIKEISSKFNFKIKNYFSS